MLSTREERSLIAREPICVIGSIIVDWLVFADNRRVSSYGGVAHNVARRLGWLGVDVSLVTTCSNDPIGDAIMGAMHEASVHVFAERTAGGIGVFEGRVRVDGEAIAERLSLPPLERIGAALLERAFARAVGTVVLETGMPASVRDRALWYAKRCGSALWALPTQVSPDAECTQALAEYDTMILNAREAGIILGRELVSVVDALAAVGDLAVGDKDLVVVTLGARGVVAAGRVIGTKQPRHFPVKNAVPAVNTLGAGDAFAATVLAETARGRTIEFAIDRALVCAAHAVMAEETAPLPLDA